MYRIHIVIGFAVVFAVSLISGDGFAAKVPSNLDCRVSTLKKSEGKLQEKVKPLLATSSEQYSGRKGELEKKEQERAEIFREWLKMRCLCQASDLSLLEKTMCQALSERKTATSSASCLLRD